MTLKSGILGTFGIRAAAVLLAAGALAACHETSATPAASGSTAGAESGADADAKPHATANAGATLAAYDVAKTEAWRAEQEAKLKAPEGWLSVAGLYFLKPGANSVGSAKGSDVQLPADAAPATVGRILVERDAVSFEPASGADVTVDGRPVTGRLELERAPAPGAERPRGKPVRLTIGHRVIVHLHHVGDRLAARLRDPESPLRREFTGLRWFDIDPAWQITGTWAPFAQPREVEIQNVLGDTLHLESPGEVEATIGGKAVRLLALTEEKDGPLWFIFSDATAPKESYKIRFLYAPLPPNATAGAPVVLDFNRAYNPPCAYNPFTTCPLPPPQNKLTVRVPAGERSYHADKPASQESN